MSGLKIDNADAFDRLLSALATDVVYAHIHLTLLLDITRAQEEYEAELAQSRTFWALTTQAHFETGLAKLARAYDSQRNALSLSTWLDTIFENLHLFSADSFRERLADNPFVESLADVDRTPDLTQLDEDRAAVAPADPLVRKLIYVRHNAVAHRGSRLVMQGRNPFEEQEMTLEDFRDLADRGMSIVNRYSSLFRASSFSVQALGAIDFVGTLALVRKGMECLEAEYEQELEGGGSTQ